MVADIAGVFGLFSSTIASAFSTPWNLFAYDEETQASIAYDGISLTAVDYDFASMLPANESRNRIGEASDAFGRIAEFLAADGTVVGVKP